MSKVGLFFLFFIVRLIILSLAKQATQLHLNKKLTPSKKSLKESEFEVPGPTLPIVQAKYVDFEGLKRFFQPIAQQFYETLLQVKFYMIDLGPRYCL